MSSSSVRLAIIGSGNIAATHAAAIAQISNAQLVAVCSRNPEKAAQIALPAKAQTFRSLGDLLAANIAEAVLIATPSGVHSESALAALGAGLHVLCEKPLEISSTQVSAMVTEAERRRVILAGFFPLRYGVGARALRQAVDDGRFGRVTFVSARVKWWREPDYYTSSSWRGTWKLDGGGALMNQGIHAVDLLQWIGGTVVEASAYSGALVHHGIEVEDTLAASLRFAHGGLGTIEAATSCYPGLDLSLEVSGDAGTAILVNDHIELWRFREDSGDGVDCDQKSAGLMKGGASDPRAISGEGHRQQIEAFCRAIRGENAEIIDGRQASRAVSIVEAIYRSVRSGKSEKVTYL